MLLSRNGHVSSYSPHLIGFIRPLTVNLSMDNKLLLQFYNFRKRNLLVKRIFMKEWIRTNRVLYSGSMSVLGTEGQRFNSSHSEGPFVQRVFLARKSFSKKAFCHIRGSPLCQKSLFSF